MNGSLESEKDRIPLEMTKHADRVVAGAAGSALATIYHRILIPLADLLMRICCPGADRRLRGYRSDMKSAFVWGAGTQGY